MELLLLWPPLVALLRLLSSWSHFGCLLLLFVAMLEGLLLAIFTGLFSRAFSNQVADLSAGPTAPVVGRGAVGQVLGVPEVVLNKGEGQDRTCTPSACTAHTCTHSCWSFCSPGDFCDEWGHAEEKQSDPLSS